MRLGLGRCLAVLPVVGVVCFVATLASAVPASERASRSTTLTRLVPPPDGQAHFGLTFPLFDTNDPIVDSCRRRFAYRPCGAPPLPTSAATPR
jgi:hypothetical protein